MATELSAMKTIDMIDRLYCGRDTVSKDDVVAEARTSDLGQDGVRIIEGLHEGDYTKDQLIMEISGSLVNQGGRST